MKQKKWQATPLCILSLNETLFHLKLIYVLFRLCLIQNMSEKSLLNARETLGRVKKKIAFNNTSMTSVCALPCSKYKHSSSAGDGQDPEPAVFIRLAHLLVSYFDFLLSWVETVNHLSYSFWHEYWLLYFYLFLCIWNQSWWCIYRCKHIHKPCAYISICTPVMCM